MPKFFKQNLRVQTTDPEHLLTPPHLLEDPQTLHPALADPNTYQHLQPPLNYQPIQTLLSWKAFSRPFRKKNRSYYTTVTILIVLVSLIALLAGEKLLIGALFALVFVIYVLGFVVPEEVEFKISTQGITIADQFYHWNSLDSFWISEKEGHKILSILTNLRFPAMLMLPLGDSSEEEIKSTCARFLPYHEIAPKTLMDKWSEFLQRHFPLENPHR